MFGPSINCIGWRVDTYKMHTGHRGINHPILNLETNKCEVTSQNHGFTIDEESLKNNTDIKVTHRNLNDNSMRVLVLRVRLFFLYNIILNLHQVLMILDIYLMILFTHATLPKNKNVTN